MFVDAYMVVWTLLGMVAYAAAVGAERRAQAEARLNDAGLKLDRKDVWSSTAPEGVVSQQTPPPGTKVARGSVVTLTVSQGVEKVPVPDVVGLSEDKAQKALQQAGFKNYPLLTSILMAGPWPFALTPSSRWSK